MERKTLAEKLKSSTGFVILIKLDLTGHYVSYFQIE